MSKKKTEETQAPEAKIEAKTPEASLAQATEDAFMKISAEERQKLADQALDDVCKMIGVSRDQLQKMQKQREEAKALAANNQRRVDLGPYSVNVNGKTYRGVMVVDEPVAEVLMETIGKKRQRILREAMKREFMAEYEAGGKFKQTLVNSVQ